MKLFFVYFLRPAFKGTLTKLLDRNSNGCVNFCEFYKYIYPAISKPCPVGPKNENYNGLPYDPSVNEECI